jgi:hypothetical protein
MRAIKCRRCGTELMSEPPPQGELIDRVRPILLRTLAARPQCELRVSLSIASSH